MDDKWVCVTFLLLSYVRNDNMSEPLSRNPFIYGFHKFKCISYSFYAELLYVWANVWVTSGCLALCGVTILVLFCYFLMLGMLKCPNHSQETRLYMVSISLNAFDIPFMLNYCTFGLTYGWQVGVWHSAEWPSWYFSVTFVC